MVPNTFQFFGAALIVLFLYACWPPLALLGTGLALFILGAALEVPKPIEKGSD